VQLLVDPNFDDLSTAWVASSKDIITDSITAPLPPQSGGYLAWLGGYDNAVESLAQTVTLSSTFSGGTFSYYYRIATKETTTTAAYDYLRVQIQSTTGTVLQTLATYSNLSANSDWTQATFTLPASYAGQSIALTFAATTDSTNNTNFFIDTISFRSCSSL
jgi:hypothetical protein